MTFQDHPYQPRLLDAWTLLSWIAGRTERVHIAANVLKLKAHYDPTNVFRDNFNIEPQATNAGSS